MPDDDRPSAEERASIEAEREAKRRAKKEADKAAWEAMTPEQRQLHRAKVARERERLAELRKKLVDARKQGLTWEAMRLQIPRRVQCRTCKSPWGDALDLPLDLAAKCPNGAGHALQVTRYAHRRGPQAFLTDLAKKAEKEDATAALAEADNRLRHVLAQLFPHSMSRYEFETVRERDGTERKVPVWHPPNIAACALLAKVTHDLLRLHGADVPQPEPGPAVSLFLAPESAPPELPSAVPVGEHVGESVGETIPAETPDAQAHER